jgi:hypothetical protein
MAQYLKGLERNGGGRLSWVKAVERLEISVPNFRRFRERDRWRGGRGPDRVRGRVVPDALWELHDEAIPRGAAGEHGFKPSCRLVKAVL